MKKYVGIACVAMILLAVYYEGGMPKRRVEKVVPPASSSAQVTFIELGSVTCIPCRAMQPVMRDLEKKFGDQIRIVFYDIVQDEAAGKTYNVRVMPTQVFLDRDGKEFHRHEGFYPLKSIESLLLARGMKAMN
jgi:thioredoxin 1